MSTPIITTSLTTSLNNIYTILNQKNIIYDVDFCNMLNLQFSNNVWTDLSSYDGTVDTNNSDWYLNWLGSNDSSYTSNLNTYISFLDLTLSGDLYPSNIADWRNISSFLFQKFLNTPIYYLDINKNIYVKKSPLIYPKISIDGRNTFSNMQIVLLRFFRNYGILNDDLNNEVKNNTDKYTRVKIASSPALKQWFGCFSPDLLINSNSTFNNDNKGCDPLCNGEDKIYLVDDKGQKKECKANICVISNITLDETNTNIYPKINQICPQCKSGGNCLCIVDVTVPGVLNKIEGNGKSLNDPDMLKQFCPNATCIQFDPITGINNVVECEKTTTNIKSSYWFEKYISVYGLVILIFITIVLGLLFSSRYIIQK